ncbi:unnamed protein product [Schistocephalus solidus]|uniref:Uncharacterized protein n=1 Tax=Schistocephalus solidus TaxID=70667 RepID=A0A183SPF6_SCHSO|nr:unnamed protein product [Schistocephalus solidus]
MGQKGPAEVPNFPASSYPWREGRRRLTDPPTLTALPVKVLKEGEEEEVEEEEEEEESVNGISFSQILSSSFCCLQFAPQNSAPFEALFMFALLI